MTRQSSPLKVVVSKAQHKYEEEEMVLLEFDQSDLAFRHAVMMLNRDRETVDLHIKPGRAGARAHESTAKCWCEPDPRFKDPETTREIFKHRDVH